MKVNNYPLIDEGTSSYLSRVLTPKDRQKVAEANGYKHEGSIWAMVARKRGMNPKVLEALQQIAQEKEQQ